VDNQSKHWAGERDSPCRPYGSHLGVGRFAVGSDLVGRRRRGCCRCSSSVDFLVFDAGWEDDDNDADVSVVDGWSRSLWMQR